MTVKSIADVLDAAKNVAKYIQTNRTTPGTVTVGGLQVSRATFNRMMAAAIVEIDNRKMRNILTTNVNEAPKPIGGLPEGKLFKNDYISAAKEVMDFVAANKRMPNYIVTPLGKMSLFNLMDMFSRALNFYADNKSLPAFIYTNSLAGIASPVKPVIPSIPEELKQYLGATLNCQVKDPVIQSLAKQFKTAKDAFNYVRDALDYEFPMYFNTRKGALNTYKAKKGNCCDLSHLLIAILRAMGIPARYKHVYAEFKDGNTGHVYGQAYVAGEWVSLDASNNRNTYEEIVSFKIQKVYNTYKGLPF